MKGFLINKIVNAMRSTLKSFPEALRSFGVTIEEQPLSKEVPASRRQPPAMETVREEEEDAGHARLRSSSLDRVSLDYSDAVDVHAVGEGKPGTQSALTSVLNSREGSMAIAEGGVASDDSASVRVSRAEAPVRPTSRETPRREAWGARGPQWVALVAVAAAGLLGALRAAKGHHASRR